MSEATAEAQANQHGFGIRPQEIPQKAAVSRPGAKTCRGVASWRMRVLRMVDARASALVFRWTSEDFQTLWVSRVLSKASKKRKSGITKDGMD